MSLHRRRKKQRKRDRKFIKMAQALLDSIFKNPIIQKKIDDRMDKYLTELTLYGHPVTVFPTHDEVTQWMLEAGLMPMETVSVDELKKEYEPT